MSNVQVRLLVFFIGLPILLAIVVVFDEPYHIGFNLLAIVTSAICTVEAASLFAQKAENYQIHGIGLPLLGTVLPISAFLAVAGIYSIELQLGILAIATMATLGVEAFRKDPNEFSDILPHTTTTLVLLLYPGLFIAYAVRLTALPQATALVLVFLCAVYLNDSLAYATGMLFGRHSRSILAVSPNKTLIGFIGGFVMSPATIFAASAFRPDLFPCGPVLHLIIGCTVGLAVILGDLAESALKRSATIKDSGAVIPGRGGLLDSVDSALFAAPVYYYLYQILYL